ncbi:restriction endonuclease [Mesobacillus foraminis]|uniref:Restriction system protein n=1 Tax=Mesobacillus foraminis TaxID=279826 RepID=A0A4R2B163_9BACI|nr:restriction endonuclease [Mesobacillus foraminis]TCN18949.1 restriction system protein [Mesobacillus foraminis]
MVMPKQSDIEIPLLEVLVYLGGQGTPKEIYPLVTNKFPTITQEDIDERMESGGNKWTNRIQWVRQKLVDSGDMYSPQRGIWGITEKGRNRVQSPITTPSAPVNLVELYEDYEEDFKSQLLDKLHELTPRQFEEFAKKLLQVYGFVSLAVTDVGPDGGIDGYGRLKIGLATMNVAFQCKRWQGNVGRREIQQFRGAIQGTYEQGIFFTTSDFTSQATAISFQQGAVPIILMNGTGIVDIMIEKGLGVVKKPLYLYNEKVQDFLDE